MTILQRYSLSNILCLLIFSFYCGSVIAKDKVPDLIPGTMKITAEQLIDLVETKEATRAGESGRGFAVVADEVRSLASRTQDFTLEIQTVINELQTQAREAVDSMTRGTSRVESSVLHINSTGEALHGITAAINKITQMSEQIASASEEQNAVSVEASRNMENISNLSNETTHGAESVAANAQQLAALSATLKGAIQRFRL